MGSFPPIPCCVGKQGLRNDSSPTQAACLLVGTSISPPGTGGARKPCISSGLWFLFPPGLQSLHCFLGFFLWSVSSFFLFQVIPWREDTSYFLLSTIHLVSSAYPLSSGTHILCSPDTHLLTRHTPGTHQTSRTAKMGIHPTSHFTGLLCVKGIDDVWSFRWRAWLYSHPQLFLIVCL